MMKNRTPYFTTVRLWWAAGLTVLVSIPQAAVELLDLHLEERIELTTKVFGAIGIFGALLLSYLALYSMKDESTTVAFEDTRAGRTTSQFVWGAIAAAATFFVAELIVIQTMPNEPESYVVSLLAAVIGSFIAIGVHVKLYGEDPTRGGRSGPYVIYVTDHCPECKTELSSKQIPFRPWQSFRCPHCSSVISTGGRETSQGSAT
jgi:hypothetical protein